MQHKNLLTCAGKPAIFLYNLTKKLASQSAHPDCAVLPFYFGTVVPKGDAAFCDLRAEG